MSEAAESLRDRLTGKTYALPKSRLRRGGGDAKPAGTSPTREEPKAPPARTDYAAVKARLHDRLLDLLSDERADARDEEAMARRVDQFVERVLDSEDLPLNEDERRRLADDLRDETLGVGPLAPLLADPAVTDILVNGPDVVYVERFGRLEESEIRFRDADHLVRIIQRIAGRVGRRIDESVPMVDARLPDGSRVNATLPPVTIDGPTLSIRRFGRQRLKSGDLLGKGMFSDQMGEFLRLAVRTRRNILVAGGTGAGKSTALGAIAEAIPDTERVITVEDAAELSLDQRHVVRKETRPPNLEGEGRITARDLVVNSLRMRPDRIIVGEVRGAEALDMLQAMNTGHDGSLTTVHSNSPRDAISRLETMVLMAGVDLPSRAIREQIASAIELIVFVRRYDDGVRRIERISELTGLEEGTPQLQDVYVFKQTGRSEARVEGRFEATGIVPRFVYDLRERGEDVPQSLFQRPSSGAA